VSRPQLLVLRALGLGDLLTAVPAGRALRRAHPGHELVLAAPAPLAPLVAGIGGVDRLHAVPAYVRAPISRLPWRGPGPDVAVNLHGSGPQSHRALLATRPGRLLAYARPDAGHPGGPAWRDDEHEGARWCRLLAAYGVPADPQDLGLPAPPPVPDLAGAVVLHPGASGPERRWPVRRFAGVARAVRRDGHRVLVTGVPAELTLARAVAEAAGLPPQAVLAGRTDLATLGAVVAHARLLVCGDTGVAHLATAYGTPSVLLFGPMSPAIWGPPPGRDRHTVLWRGPDGLDRITAAEVVEAARAVLGGTRDAAATR
jgi:ADP-heptose:LPS heptosyltransferase